MNEISWEDFTKVELRVGRVVSAEVFAQARKPAYVLHVDFGEALGIRKSSAQITALYTPEELVGRLVVAVVNFPRKQVAITFDNAHAELSDVIALLASLGYEPELKFADLEQAKPGPAARRSG